MISDLFPVETLDEPRTIVLGASTVAYLLRRSVRRRRIVLTVDEHGLAVDAPWRASQAGIDRFLRNSTTWVKKKLEEWSRFKPRSQRWAAGESIRYIGRLLTLEVAAAPAAATVVLQDNDRLLACLPAPGDESAVRSAVVAWYRHRARTNFDERLAHYGRRLDVSAPRWLLSSARTRWGSCNGRGEVRLNWRLIQAPQAAIDYVVVHELAHLKEMNHSRRFWRLVEKAFPGHEQARQHLEENGRWYLAM